MPIYDLPTEQNSPGRLFIHCPGSIKPLSLPILSLPFPRAQLASAAPVSCQTENLLLASGEEKAVPYFSVAAYCRISGP